MNIQDPNGIEDRDDSADDAALRAGLSALRRDCPPPRDLWSGIETRIAMPAVPSMLVEDRRPSALSILRTEAVPQRDFWPEIENRIRMQRWRRLRTPLSAAAAVAASLVFVLALQVTRTGDAPKAVDHAPLRASAAVVAAMRDADSAEDASLRRVSVHPLTPETRALVRANLKIVANAETQLKRAIAADPDAAYLKSLLETAHQQKQDLRYALAER